MKRESLNQFYVFINCIAISLLTFISSCDHEVEIVNREAYQKLYIPQAIKGLKSIEYIGGQDKKDTLKIGAAVGGFDKITAAISIKFEVDIQALDAYNDLNRTSYLLLPETAYELSSWNVTIPAGEVSSSLSELIISSTGLQLDQEYLLPIRIIDEHKSIDQYDENGQIYYVYVKSTPPAPVYYEDFSRAGWEVVDYSSHDPWEGVGEGHALTILDDNAYTFWISKWLGGALPFPHSISIDMKTAREVHGLTFMNRTFWQNETNGEPKNVSIYVSLNGSDWDFVQDVDDIPGPEFGVPPAGKWIRMDFDNAVSARYFKLVVTGVHGAGTVVNIAEIGAY
ncbi:BT_3987 domain-containing protein [Sphingobacterium sp. HJSM2_6]|uniref:BT_3987 domain-containing protein n=1 Tax=Sphingobacterium sp. HJSM2_6 TaxID=3366264 RepID=UPI003BC16151